VKEVVFISRYQVCKVGDAHLAIVPTKYVKWAMPTLLLFLPSKGGDAHLAIVPPFIRGVRGDLQALSWHHRRKVLGWVMPY
jgi:hypothetical protein